MSHYHDRGRTSATCHPERFVKSNGLCSACEVKARYAANPQHFRDLQAARRLRIGRPSRAKASNGERALPRELANRDMGLPMLLWGMKR